VHKVLVCLTIDGEALTTTPEHPFLQADGQWTPAGELEVDSAVRNADGEYGTVGAIEFAATPQVMYNMTVADAHTYTVGDGEWVVHNQCQALYHGTYRRAANNILSGGIDLSRGRPYLDFNPVNRSGFYVTNSYTQATVWAKRLATRERDESVVLEFVIPQLQLGQLNGKVFTVADSEWAAFVIAGRENTLVHSFDYVEGPMLANPRDVTRGVTAVGIGHQFAIFTDAAAELFQNYLKIP
jgi:hypothetical protein